MLDQQHADAAPVADPPDFSAERVDLLVIEPGGGLVEQQQLRLDRRARARVPRASGRRSGSSPTGRSATSDRPKFFDQRVGALGDPRSSRRRGQAPGLGEKAAARASRGCRPSRFRARSCVANSARFWNVRAMPSSAMAWRGAVSRPRRRSGSSRLGAIEPRDAVEQRGLAGPVGSDQPQICPPHCEARPRRAPPYAAEPNRHTVDLEERRALRAERHAAPRAASSYRILRDSLLPRVWGRGEMIVTCFLALRRARGPRHKGATGGVRAANVSALRGRGHRFPEATRQDNPLRLSETTCFGPVIASDLRIKSRRRSLTTAEAIWVILVRRLVATRSSAWSAATPRNSRAIQELGAWA